METKLLLHIQRLRPTAQLPLRASEGAAGWDVHACIEEPLVLGVGKRALVPTGFAMALPADHEAQIRARSGWAYKHGVMVLNGPGTIDEDYRGEVKVLLANLGQEPFTIHPGDRVAQIVVQRVPSIVVAEVETLPSTVRGAGGFGSTGQ